jgi:hypothetical protein
MRCLPQPSCIRAPQSAAYFIGSLPTARSLRNVVGGRDEAGPGRHYILLMLFFNIEHQMACGIVV